jgi:hypothetical protein
MDQLYEEMTETAPGYAHYAVTSMTDLTAAAADGQQPLSTTYWNAGAYGFLLVVGVLDFWRSVWNLTRYHVTSDLRAQTLTLTYPDRAELTPRRWWLWVFFTRVRGAIGGGASVVRSPANGDDGWDYALRVVQQHNRMGWGVWYAFYALHYLFFAWPWWNHLILGRTGWVWRLLSYLTLRHDPWTALTLVVTRLDPLGGLWFAAYTTGCLVAAVVYWYRYRFPLAVAAPALILLYPLYLAASPIFFVVARWYVSFDGRKRRRQKNNKIAQG